MVKIGIIGGSGLDNPDILQNAKDIQVITPYGETSSPLKTGTIAGVDVILLARHGREHTIPPTEVPFQANIWALKEAGCTHILATTACGSLREEIKRGDFVILDQFIDFTRHRAITFYEEFKPHEPKHTPMAEPFSDFLRKKLNLVAANLGVSYHPVGTVITIEGPRFSTKAESHMFRAWGADVINMSIAPEAILANELEISYAAVAMSTDYDCWKDDEEAVTWETIMETFQKNAKSVTELLVKTIPLIANFADSSKNDCSDNIDEDVEIDTTKDVDDVSVDNEKTYSEKSIPLTVEKTSTTDRLDRTDTSFAYEHLIRNVPDFPKPGIQFKDITTLIKDPEALKVTIREMARPYLNKKIDVVVGAESRGFIFGTGIAIALGVGFVPARKPGKLPAAVSKAEYKLEYGTDCLEIHNDAITPGMNVLLVDDLIATGGTITAVAKLIETLGGNIVGISFLIDLITLHPEFEYDYTSLVTYELDE